MARNEVYLSTELVEPGLQTEVWRAIARPFFEATACSAVDQTPLQGSLRSSMIGSLLIGSTTFNTQQYRRDRGVILQSGLDQYLLQLFVGGRLDGDCDGRSLTVSPGDICVFDLARPFSSRVSPGSTVSAVLPRKLVDRAAGGVSLHGSALRAGQPITRLLTEFMHSLSSLAEELPSTDIEAMEEAAIRLLAAGLTTGESDASSDNRIEDPVLEPVLHRRVLDFIDAHLTDPQLGPALLLSHFRVSRAHLYRMLAAEGGIARIVRERRLDAAYRIVTDQTQSPESLTQLAYRLGFASSSQFTRAFRNRFDLSPRDARQAALSLSNSDQRLAGLQHRFRRYADQLDRSSLQTNSKAGWDTRPVTWETHEDASLMIKAI